MFLLLLLLDLAVVSRWEVLVALSVAVVAIVLGRQG